MNFKVLRQRVKRAEAVVAVRTCDTAQRWNGLRQVWREGWTPLRIITVGLAGGFVAGKMEPKGKFTGARWLQMIGSVSNLIAAAQASFAVQEAAGAADSAEAAAQRNDDAAPPLRPTPGRASPAPASQPPRAAEAATEMSES
ncbi:MAG: protein sip-5 [Stenotrophomonas sp.]